MKIILDLIASCVVPTCNRHDSLQLKTTANISQRRELEAMKENCTNDPEKNSWISSLQYISKLTYFDAQSAEEEKCNIDETTPM